MTTMKVWNDPLNPNLNTVAHIFSIDRGISWADAKRRLEHEILPGDLMSGFRRAKRPVHASASMLLAMKRPTGGGGGGKGGSHHHQGEKAGGFAIYRPGTGVASFDMDKDDLDAKYYRPMQYESDADVEEAWTECYESALRSCIHGSNCQLGSDCQIGRRLSRVAILSGSVVRVWGTLEQVISKHETRLSRAERSLRVVRVEINDNNAAPSASSQPSSSAPSPAPAVVEGPSSHVVGVRFPEYLISEVIQTLAMAQQATAGLKQQQASMSAYFNPGGGLGGGKGDIRGGGTRTEPPSAIQTYSMSKAFTKPKQITDFFKPKEPQPVTKGGKLSIEESFPLKPQGNGGGKDREGLGVKKPNQSIFKPKAPPIAGVESEGKANVGTKSLMMIPSVLASSSLVASAPPAQIAIEYISLDNSQEDGGGSVAGEGGVGGKGEKRSLEVVAVESSAAPKTKKARTKEEKVEELMKLCGVNEAEATRNLFLSNGNIEKAADIILQQMTK